MDLSAAVAHLERVDPVLRALIAIVGPCAFAARAEGTHFEAVARAIVYQQLSGKAAGTIHGRFHALYGGRAPEPPELLATSDEDLRGAGLSRQKIGYLRDLAGRVAAGEVPLPTIEALDDEAAIAALIRVKGVGRWTAQVFLMFRLGRPDILPELDLGVQKGIQLAYGLPAMPAPKDVLEIGRGVGAVPHGGVVVSLAEPRERRRAGLSVVEPLGGPVYAECAPDAALAPWVRCFWSMRGTAANELPNRVLPDGCADVIVDLAHAPYAFAVGPMQTAAVVPTYGRVDVFGVRFHPGAALPVFDAPLDALRDRDVALGTLWGALAAELEGTLAEAAPGDRVRHATRILVRRLAPATVAATGSEREHATVARAVALMRQSRGSAGVRDVAAALGVGERWLERAFDRRVGLSPKFLARVERFRHAVRLIDDAAAPSWTAIAYDAGYADQAHLTRECRALAGVTPTALAAERRRVGFVQYVDQDGA